MSEKSLKEKLRIIHQRWPRFKSKLKEELAENSTVTGDTPHKVLVYGGCHISSAFDPESEAEVQASVLDGSEEVIWVYGIGSGFLIENMLKQSWIKKINLVFFNHRLFVESLKEYPNRWVDDKRVELFFAGELKYPSKPFLNVYAELIVAEKKAYPLRDRVVMELDEGLKKKRLEDRKLKFDIKNIVENDEYIKNDKSVSEYFNQYQGKVVTVVAGGETLQSYIDNPVESDCLIAVSTAVNPLIKGGIVPQFVIAIDGHDNMVDHFDIISNKDLLKSSVFVYSPTVPKKMLHSWPGLRCIFKTDDSVFNGVQSVLKLKKLYCSGTVTHCAVDLAVKLGAKEVRLVGADFGYPSGYTHAENSAARKKADFKTRVTNYDGQEIMSRPALIAFMRDLEVYISLNKSVEFRSFSKESAKIDGVGLMI